MSFSLTHPTPTPHRRARDGRDYAGLALAHWHEADGINVEFEHAWAASSDVGVRLMRGDAWFRTHGLDHPEAERARRTYNRLLEQQHRLLFEVKAKYVSLWLRVCAVYGALREHDDVDGWLELHAPGVTENTPTAFWARLQPDRAPPFTTFPPPPEASHIEPGFHTREQLEAWMHRDEGRTGRNG